MKTLITWLGQHDLGALDKEKTNGPIWAALTKEKFQKIIIISNYKTGVKSYTENLIKNFDIDVNIYEVDLADPTDWATISNITREVLFKNNIDQIEFESLFFLLSSGTWAMAANWILLSQSEFPANLIQTALIEGIEIVKLVNVPFEISSRLLLKTIERQDETILKFKNNFNIQSHLTINWQTPEMLTLIKNANIASQRFLPTLILGDNGTEKDVIANAIFEINKDKAINYKPFIIDYNQIGEDNFIMELNDIFESKSNISSNKTDQQIPIIYLPDIDNLSVKAQKFVKSLLKDFLSKENYKSFHLISSCSHNLIEKMKNGQFDMILFHRLSHLMLKIPALYERALDLESIIKAVLERTNKAIFGEDKKAYKEISPSGLGILKSHKWPGNIEELDSFISRLVAINYDIILGEAEILASLINFDSFSHKKETILFKPINDGLDLNEVIASVVQHYLPRAMDAAEGSKIKAAKLLGFTNHQTMTNWVNRYNVNVPSTLNRG